MKRIGVGEMASRSLRWKVILVTACLCVLMILLQMAMVNNYLTASTKYPWEHAVSVPSANECSISNKNAIPSGYLTCGSFCKRLGGGACLAGQRPRTALQWSGN